MRFGMGEHLGGEDGIDQRGKFGMLATDDVHLVLVGAGDNRRLHAFGTEAPHEVHHAGDVVVAHRLLEGDEFRGKQRMLFRQMCEMLLEYLREGLPLYHLAEFLDFRKIFPALRVPKQGVLALGVQHHTVQVEQGSYTFCRIHSHFRLSDAKLGIICNYGRIYVKVFGTMLKKRLSVLLKTPKRFARNA